MSTKRILIWFDWPDIEPAPWLQTVSVSGFNPPTDGDERGLATAIMSHFYRYMDVNARPWSVLAVDPIQPAQGTNAQAPFAYANLSAFGPNNHARQRQNPLPEWVALNYKITGQDVYSGSMSLFHSLDASDVVDPLQHPLTLKNVTFFHDFEERFLYDTAPYSNLSFTKIVEGLGPMPSLHGQPFRCTLNAPAKYRRRSLYRQKIRPKQTECIRMALGMHRELERFWRQWLNDYGVYKDYISIELARKTLEYGGYLQKVADKMQEIEDETNPDTGETYPKPLSRWGIDWNSLKANVESLAKKPAKNTETINEMIKNAVDQTAQGQGFTIKNEEALELFDMLKEYREDFGICLNFDWTTHLGLVGQEEPA